MILQIPYNVKTHELRGSIVCIGEDGILYSSPKPNSPVNLTDEEIYEEMKRFRKIIGKEKICMIAETGKGGGNSPNKKNVVSSLPRWQGY